MSKIRTYTVSQVNGLIKGALQQALPAKFTVRGEIRDFKHHYSGHCYFMLKDASGVLPCVMWASKFKSVKFDPDDGMAVLGTGYVDVYPAGGKYQFYVDKLEPEGVGALQLAFEQMVARLEAEGLFNDEHKQPIPPYARRIAVLTSESGAALHDIADSIFMRWPVTELFLYPVPVQGDGAGARIAEAITWINANQEKLKLDLLIVGRGGGSQEDLWAFNEEDLARAIFASHVPIISAVGHEVDTTVADLVADARASTPTKAGMVAVPDKEEVVEDLRHCLLRLQASMRSRLQLSEAQLDALCASEVVRRPDVQLRDRYLLLDDLFGRLMGGAREGLHALKEELADFQSQVQRIEPHRLLGRQHASLTALKGRLTMLMERVLHQGDLRLEGVSNRLEGLNPKSVLKRGYSITKNQRTGALVRCLEDVKGGDRLITELDNENFVESEVTKG